MVIGGRRALLTWLVPVSGRNLGGRLQFSGFISAFQSEKEIYMIRSKLERCFRRVSAWKELPDLPVRQILWTLLTHPHSPTHTR
jgi:hypothetical protein